jgi:hypothetical protein
MSSSIDDVSAVDNTPQTPEEQVDSEKTQKEHDVEETAISLGTATRGVMAVAPPLDNPLTSPGQNQSSNLSQR